MTLALRLDLAETFDELAAVGPILYSQIPKQPNDKSLLCKRRIDELIESGVATLLWVKGRPEFVAAVVSNGNA